jgi:hypothetical protein
MGDTDGCELSVQARSRIPGVPVARNIRVTIHDRYDELALHIIDRPMAAPPDGDCEIYRKRQQAGNPVRLTDHAAWNGWAFSFSRTPCQSFHAQPKIQLRCNFALHRRVLHIDIQ